MLPPLLSLALALVVVPVSRLKAKASSIQLESLAFCGDLGTEPLGNVGVDDACVFPLARSFVCLTWIVSFRASMVCSI